MNKILLFALWFLFFTSAVSAQTVSVSKSVEPGEVLVGGEALVIVFVQSDVPQKLRVVDRAPSAFEVVSLEPQGLCTQEIEELTNISITLRCNLTSVLSSSIYYAIKAKEGGVYSLPEAVVITERGAEVASRSKLRLIVGVEVSPPPTTTPPPPPPELERGGMFKLIRIVSAVFPEPIRFILLGLLLFLALILVLIVPFVVFLRKGED